MPTACRSRRVSCSISETAFRDSTIANNTVESGYGAGGGIFVGSTSATIALNNSIVSGNQTAGQGDDVAGAVQQAFRSCSTQRPLQLSLATTI